ncbi:MAG: hypothetical protein ACLFUI_02110 [Halanaerobiales bacterium]
MTDEEMRDACRDFIDEYVGFEIDWDDPPGPATLALERMKKSLDPEMAGVATESIDDLSRSFLNYAGIDPATLQLLNTIRKMKW